MSWHRSMLFEVDQAGAPSVSNSPRSRIGATYRPPERHGAACGACSRGAPRSLGARRPLPRAGLSTLKFFSNLSSLSSGEFLKVYFSFSVCKVRVGVGLLGFFLGLHNVKGYATKIYRFFILLLCGLLLRPHTWMSSFRLLFTICSNCSYIHYPAVLSKKRISLYASISYQKWHEFAGLSVVLVCGGGRTQSCFVFGSLVCRAHPSSRVSTAIV
jgi:hypothetical protein